VRFAAITQDSGLPLVGMILVSAQKPTHSVGERAGSSIKRKRSPDDLQGDHLPLITEPCGAGQADLKWTASWWRRAQKGQAPGLPAEPAVGAAEARGSMVAKRSRSDAQRR